jgi:hypothetical protein
MLLLLLQGFSPLVHAHVHVQLAEDVSEVHIHMYQLDIDTAPIVVSPDIIGCGGVQNNLHADIEQPNVLDMEQAWQSLNIACLQTPSIDKYIAFSPHSGVLKSALIDPIAAPRAPPFFKTSL